MYLKPTAPLSIGGVIDDAIKLYRSTFATAWPIALAGGVALAIPGAFLLMRMHGATSGNPQAALAFFKSPAFWMTYAFTLLVYVFFSVALIAHQHLAALGQAPTAGESLGVATRLLPRAIVTFVLLTLIIGATLVLFIVPGIYFFGVLQLTFVVMVVENAGPAASMGGSMDTIKGYWWRSVAIYSVAAIILFVLYLLIGLINGALGAALGRSGAITIIVSQVLAVASRAFLMPLLPAVLVAMYHDLKLRKEGTDLAKRVNTMTSG